MGSHFLLPEPGCNGWFGHPLDQEQRATFPAFAVNDIGSLKLKARGLKYPGLGHFGRAPMGALGAIEWPFDSLVELTILGRHPAHNLYFLVGVVRVCQVICAASGRLAGGWAGSCGPWNEWSWRATEEDCLGPVGGVSSWGCGAATTRRPWLSPECYQRTCPLAGQPVGVPHSCAPPLGPLFGGIWLRLLRCRLTAPLPDSAMSGPQWPHFCFHSAACLGGMRGFSCCKLGVFGLWIAG